MPRSLRAADARRWLSHVRFVAAKDIRHSRSILALYAALVAVGATGFVTGAALRPEYTATVDDLFGSVRYLLVMYPAVGVVAVGSLLAASLPQLDTPLNADAFWASRPVSWSAMLAAKLLLLVTIVALTVPAELVALRSYDLAAGAMAVPIGHATLYYGAWLLAALAVGAATEDLRGFFAVFGALVLAVIIVRGSTDNGGRIASHAAPGLLASGAIVGLGSLAFLYRVRDARGVVRGTAVAAAACLMLATTADWTRREHPAPRLAGGPSLEIRAVDLSTWGASTPGWIDVRVARLPESTRFTLTPTFLHLHGRQGASVSSRGPDGVAFVASVDDTASTQLEGTVGGALPPVGQRLRWIIDRDRAMWPSAIRVDPSGAIARLQAQGFDSITVGGTVTVSRARLMPTCRSYPARAPWEPGIACPRGA